MKAVQNKNLKIIRQKNHGKYHKFLQSSEQKQTRSMDLRLSLSKSTLKCMARNRSYQEEKIIKICCSYDHAGGYAFSLDHAGGYDFPQTMREDIIFMWKPCGRI